MMTAQAQVQAAPEAVSDSAAYIKMRTEAQALAAGTKKNEAAFESFAWRVIDAARASELTAEEAEGVIREYVFKVHEKKGTRKAYMSWVRAVLDADPAGDAEAKDKWGVFHYGKVLAKAAKDAAKDAEAEAEAKAAVEAQAQAIADEAIRIANGAPVTPEVTKAACASLEERLRSEAEEAAKANLLEAIHAAAAAAMVAGIPIEAAQAAFDAGYTL